jgi:hypothetical protein
MADVVLELYYLCIIKQLLGEKCKLLLPLSEGLYLICESEIGPTESDHLFLQVP